ncbi:hypothetical protein BVY03_05735, partial [bacterium K02(2017)]
ISLFILIDPLKIGEHVNVKLYRLFGYITLFASVAFSLDYFSGFPVWLWAVPLIIYLSPYLISPLKKRLSIIMAVSWIVVFSYVGLIGYVIYAKYNPQADVSLIQKFLPQLKVPKVKTRTYSENELTYSPPAVKNKTTTSTLTKQKIPNKIKPKTNTPIKKSKQQTITPAPQNNTKIAPGKTTTASGPYIQGLKEADHKFLSLLKEHENLKNQYQKIVEENKKLTQELSEVKGIKKKPASTITETL